MINLYGINVNGNYKLDLKLRRPDESVVADIPITFVEGVDLKFNDTSSLNLKIPRYLCTSKGEMVLNPNYDFYSDKMLISLNQNYMFSIDGSTIKENEKSSKECNKTFTAFTREKIFEKRFFTLKSDSTLSYRIKKDNIDTNDGVLDFLENETYGSWKAGYIDHDAIYETVDGNEIRKYRIFESIDTTWLNFLREECSDTFKTLFLFDSFAKTVDAVLEDHVGVYSGICLSFENFVKEINKSDTSNVPTRLWVDAGNKSSEVDINEVNPLGTSYIENYSPYYDIMSIDLKLALIEYNAIVQIKHLEFNQVKADLLNLQNSLSNINNALTALNEQLKMQEFEVDKSRADSTGTESIYLSQRIDAYNNTKAQIATKELEKDNTQLLIDNKNTQINNISNALNKKTCTNTNGELVFNETMLQELYSLTIEEKYSTDYFDNSQDLYDDAVKHLAELQTRTIEFTTNLINFTQAIKHPSGKDWSEIINLGDFIVIKSENLGDVGVRLIGLSFKFSSGGKQPTIDMTFSNKPKKIKDIPSQKKLLYYILKAKSTLDNNAKTWTGYDSSVNYVKSIQSYGIDLSTTPLNGTNMSVTDENMVIVDSTDPLKQVFIGGGTYAITTDGWQTKQDAVTTNGLVAESLRGNIILSDILKIKNDTDRIVIDKDGLHLKDVNDVDKVFLGIVDGEVTYDFYSSNSKKLLGNTGIVQTLPYFKTGNLDSTNPLTMKVNLPTNEIESIYSAKMFICLENYESYVDKFDPISGDTGYEEIDATTGKMTHPYTVNFPSLPQKIIKGSMASNVTINIDSVPYEFTITEDSYIDLSSYISTTGIKTIEIYSETLGRVTANLYIKYFAKL